MTRLFPTLIKPAAALGLLALVVACGPAGVHAIGVSQGCGPAASPFLSGENGHAVRCGPQTQSPAGIG